MISLIEAFKRLYMVYILFTNAELYKIELKSIVSRSWGKFEVVAFYFSLFFTYYFYTLRLSYILYYKTMHVISVILTTNNLYTALNAVSKPSI